MTEVGWKFRVRNDAGILTDIGFTTTGQYSFDIGREVTKSITGFTLVPEEAEKVSLERDQILAYLIRDNSEYQMGVFNFSNVVRQKKAVKGPEGEPADLLQVGLSDECQRLQRNDGSAETLYQGFDPAEEMRRLLDEAGIPHAVSGSLQLSGSPVTWDGSTTMLQKVRQLGELAGHRPLWMDRFGALRSVPAREIPEPIPLADLDPDYDAVTVTDYYLTAPNRIIVSDNSGGEYPIVGQWDAPGSAPHSAAKRGYITTQVVTMQGLGSLEHANAVAATLGERSTARRLTASVVPTHLLDGPVAISYDGAVWLVSSWSVSTAANSTMEIEAEEYIEGEAEVL